MDVDSGDSYLTKYLQQVAHKRQSLKTFKPSKEQEASSTRTTLIRLKLNRYKEEYMEVSEPPHLVVRTEECELNTEKQNKDLDTSVILHEENNVVASADSRPLPSSREKKFVKTAWSEANLLKKTSSCSASNNKIGNKIYKLAQKFHAKQGGGLFSSSARLVGSSSNEFGKTFSQSMNGPKVNLNPQQVQFKKFSSSNLSPVLQSKNELIEIKESSDKTIKSPIVKKSPIVQNQINGSCTIDKNLSISEKRPPKERSNEAVCHATEGEIASGVDSAKVLYQERDTSTNNNLLRNNRPNDVGSSLPHTQETEISNNNNSDGLSGKNDVRQHLIIRSGCKGSSKNHETIKNETRLFDHGLELDSGSDILPDDNSMKTTQISRNETPEKDVEVEKQSSSPSLRALSRESSKLSIGSHVAAKLQEPREKPRSKSIEKKVESVKPGLGIKAFSLKPSCNDAIESLHCNSCQGRTREKSGKTLKSRFRNLLSRESSNRSASPQNSSGVKESKRGISIFIDLPFKATLVKRETNVGAKVHKERKIRESLFGTPKLVTLEPDKKMHKKPNIPKSRKRRNSILQFFQNKNSEKEEESKVYERCRGDVLSTEHLLVQPESKPLHNKYDVKPLVSAESAPQLQESQIKETNQIKPSRSASICGSPISSPKLFRRKHASLVSEWDSPSIAKSTTYQMNERSPLSKKLEELKSIQRKRNNKTLPIFSITDEILGQDGASTDECISQEKTYKKTLPAILRLQKNVLAKENDFEQCSKLDLSFQYSDRCTSVKTESTLGQNHRYETFVNQTPSSSKSPSEFPLLRLQSPLLPSILQELEDGYHTIEWKNKLGNVFQVREKNGKYGKISCHRDPNSIRNYLSCQKTLSTCNNKSNQVLVKQRKNLSNKMWRNVSASRHCKNIRPKAKAKHAKRAEKDTKENLVVIISNGASNEVSYSC